MPELMIGVHPDPDPARYQSGDIICAFNSRRIRCCHAEMICWQETRFSPSGLRPDDSVLRKAWMERVYQFRFERVSRAEVLRVVQRGPGFNEVFSDMPNSLREYIDVPAHVSMLLSKPNHLVFGAPGREVWFGGLSSLDNVTLDQVWGEIEARTLKREKDHTRFPLSPGEKRLFLSVQTDDFDDTEAADLVSPVYAAGREIRKRARWVDIENSLELTSKEKADLKDKTIETDHRGKNFLRSNIVRRKP